MKNIETYKRRGRNLSTRYYFDDKYIYELTKRESECFFYIMEALSAKEIARKMFINKKTVEQYISVLKEKLGVKKKSELIVKAVKDRMVDTIMSWSNE